MHDVVGRRAISIKYCGSEKIARQQGRNHTRHARPRCGQPPAVPATLNTPIEDAAKTDGKESSDAEKALGGPPPTKVFSCRYSTTERGRNP
ncbi:hypothetical protein GW17_00047830 [Ensete ventricosum]|nr:hypothetical protein GW17_00047830 [Ensete ventricosum]